MSADLLLAIPFILAFFGGLALVIAAVVLVSVLRPATHLTAEVEAARRHGLITSGVAVGMLLTTPVALLLVAWVLFGRVSLVIGIVPLAATASALLALLGGELTWPRPRGATRTAVLVDRSVGSLLSGRWARSAGASAAVLVLTILAGGLLADDSRRAITHEVWVASELRWFTAGPFPGWYYGTPQAVALLLVVALVALVLRAANRRAAVVRADLETDRLLRSSSAARAYRTAVVGLLLTVSGDFILGGMAAFRVHEGGAEVMAAVTALVGVAAGAAALAALLIPVPRVIASAPPGPLTTATPPVTA